MMFCVAVDICRFVFCFDYNCRKRNDGDRNCLNEREEQRVTVENNKWSGNHELLVEIDNAEDCNGDDATDIQMQGINEKGILELRVKRILK